LADLVLPSLDAGDERLFRYVNRPVGGLSFERVVGGVAAFAERFPSKVWLEVMLLGGVTGIRPEVEKIASLVGFIRPARAQLNTVTRPPAEEFAFPLPAAQMRSFGGLFPVPVDIAGDERRERPSATTSSGASDDDIVALLARRPCTSTSISRGLGIHVTEAIKRLEQLHANGRATRVISGGQWFYAATGADGDRPRPGKGVFE
jgi:wyosine [tRNA(Phe)-imidazoG37] synthetase (radical SAM superfamily)